MHKTYYRWTALIGIIIGAAGMVVLYASGAIAPSTSLLPQTANVSLQDRWLRRTGQGQDHTAAVASGSLDYAQFEKLYSLLSGEYYDPSKLQTGALMDGALRGMIDAIGDPYTDFFDVEETSGFNSELQ